MKRHRSKSPSKTKPRKTADTLKRYILLKWALISFLWGLLAVFILIAWFSFDLPDIKHLEAGTRRPSITLLARDGTRFATLGDYYCRPITVEKLPKYVPQAFLAIEDRRFYSHFGVDVWGIFRAFWRNATAGGVVQGGSTITQQLAKNFLLCEGLYTYQDRSLRRKVQEIILALWLECKFTKNQILTLYLNRVYFGAGAFGLEGASQRYFFKSAKALTLYEAAILAGLLKAPTKFSPAASPEKADERAQQVLHAMTEAGFITITQKDTATKPTQALQMAKQGSVLGRYFADWIIEQIPILTGPIVDDLVVATTIDLPTQRLAEQEAQNIMANEAPKLGCSQVALLTLTPAGAIRAMVGGKSYFESQFNRASQALRQTGSAFKYFIYLAALERGLKPETQVVDTALKIGKWHPKNYHWESRGQISMQDGFAHSVNTVSVRIARYIGTNVIHQLTHRFGMTSSLPNDLTIALGTGEATLFEMTTAYAAMANEGYVVQPYGIVEIKTANGRVLYHHQGRRFERLISPSHVEYMRQLMGAVMEYGTGRNVAIKQACWGKSGTTQNHRDAWFIGFTTNLVTGVWMGNDDNKPMKDATGAKLSGKLWHNVMQGIKE